MLAGAGSVLFFAPTLGHDVWGWELTPFNTRFLGAVYLASLVGVAAVIVVRRWAPARLVIYVSLPAEAGYFVWKLRGRAPAFSGRPAASVDVVVIGAGPAGALAAWAEYDPVEPRPVAQLASRA